MTANRAFALAASFIAAFLVIAGNAILLESLGLPGLADASQFLGFGLFCVCAGIKICEWARSGRW